MQSAGDEDDVICLDESFFINSDYQLTSFRYGDQELELFCLQSASTDYDLTGQLVWPGAELLNNYLSNNKLILHGRSIIELGSGVGVTGLLSSRFCREIVLTDHNDEVIKVLKKNIDVHSSGTLSHADLFAEKLEWGNHSQLKEILEKHPGGFDLILGADISSSIRVFPCSSTQLCSCFCPREGSANSCWPMSPVPGLLMSWLSRKPPSMDCK
ncbi:unnamed protein product [Victoria cruziana]